MDKNQRPSRKRAKKTPEEIAKIEAEYKQLIRKSIKEGKNIVVIDNGDPTIYGPHIYFVKEFQDLAPKIIPGISSFNAANAALQTSVIGGLEDAKGVTLTVGSTKTLSSTNSLRPNRLWSFLWTESLTNSSRIS